MKKKFRKMAAVLLVVMIITLMIPFSTVSVYARTTESPNYYTAVTSYNDLLIRLESLKNKYVGTYWTTDGNASNSAGDTSKYYYGIQCNGFAKYIFNELFCCGSIGTYDSNKYYFPNPNGAYLIDKSWNFSSSDTSTVKSILTRGSIGDIIQVRRRGKDYGHTMIISGLDDSGIWIFDCNSDGKCGVKNYYQTWDVFASKNVGMSLYHANNYPNEPEINHWYDDYTPVDLGTGFYAYIEHQESGLFLTNSDRNVYGANPDGSRKQIWYFNRQSNGAYLLQSIDDGYFMDVYGPYDADNTNVHTWSEYTGGSNQQFFIYDRYGAYYFRPAHSDDRVFDMASTDDHNLSIWYHGDDWAPQEFNILRIDVDGNLPVNLGNEFYSFIEHQESGLLLTNSEHNVFGMNADGTDKQIWKFNRQPNGAYAIQSMDDGYYMDVYGPFDEDNTNVHTWSEYTGGKNQQFYIYDMYGAYYFRPAHSQNRMLDMSSTSDHNLSLWVKGSDWTPQEFNIIKIDMYGNLPVDIGSEFYAEIEHQSSGLLLTNSERNVSGAEAEGSNKQIWKFNRQLNGAYTIQSVEDGYYMDVYGPYDEDNTNVHTWPEYVGGKNQQFFVYYMYDAYYFRPVHSQTRMLDLSSESDHNLELWVGGQNWEPQEFNILKTDMYGNLPVNMGNEFYAEIEHQNSGLLLTNSNRNVFGETKTCSKNQAWKFTRISTGAYKIQNVDDGSYLDVYGVYDKDDTNVYTWPEYTGGLNQQFFIYNMYGASYLRPLHTSTRMLDMSSTEDHNLSLWIGGQDWAPQEFNINTINQNEIGKHSYIREILPTEKGVVIKYTCEKCGDYYIEHEYYIADTNLDGNIDIRDVTAIQRHICELEPFTDEQLALADANGDGEINIVDATHLQMYLAEYDVVLGKQS